MTHIFNIQRELNRKIKICLMLIFLFLFNHPFNLRAQGNQGKINKNQNSIDLKIQNNSWKISPGENFFDYKRRMDDYYAQVRIERNNNLKGTGYMDYMRWINYWQPFLYPHGDFSIIDKANKEFAETLNQKSYLRTASTGSLTWTEIGPTNYPSIGSNATANNTGVGRILYLDFDPNNQNIVFACSPVGGLFRSINGGGTWVNAGTDKALPKTGVQCVAIDKTNSTNVWYIATGDGYWQETYGVWRTQNGGINWVNIGLNIFGSTPDAINKLIIHPTNSNVLLAATSLGIYKCANASSASPTWTLVQSGNFNDIEVKPNNPNTYYASGANTTGIYYSSNSGDSWSTLPGVNFLPANFNKVDLAMTPNNPSFLFITIVGITVPDCKLYRYNVDNSTSILKSNFTQNIRSQPLAVSPINASLLYTGCLQPLQKSSDGSNNSLCTWTSTNTIHDDMRYITLTPNGNAVWAATDGGVFVTLDNGVTWTPKNNGLGVATIHEIGITEQDNTLITSGQWDCSSTIFRKPSTQWQASSAWVGDGIQTLIDYTNKNTIYVSAQGGYIGRSDNGGSTFTYVGTSTHWYTVFIMNSSNPNILYATGPAGVQRTTDKGASWNLWSNFPGTTGTSTSRIATSPTNSNYLYVSLADVEHKLFKSTTGGGTGSTDWVQVLNNIPNKQIDNITVDKEDPNHVWIIYAGVLSGSKVYSVNTTTNQWTDMSQGIPSYVSAGSLVQDLNDPSVLYLGTTRGVYYFDPISNTWLDITGNLPNVPVRAIKINQTSKELIVGTFGRGVWNAPLFCKPETTDLNLTGISPSCYRHASNSITANTTINNSINVNYKAGSLVLLTPTFNALQGSKFRAFIDPCIETLFVNANNDINNSALTTIDSPTIHKISKSLEIFPNPTDGTFTLIPSGEISTIYIYDVLGNTVYNQKLQGKTEIDLSDKPKGLYFIKAVSQDGKTEMKKVITQ